MKGSWGSLGPGINKKTGVTEESEPVGTLEAGEVCCPHKGSKWKGPWPNKGVDSALNTGTIVEHLLCVGHFIGVWDEKLFSFL